MIPIQNIDLRRETVAAEISSARKSELGQFMTPSGIAGFMTDMFSDLKNKEIQLLDAGAGIGSLTAAFIERTAQELPHSLHCTASELDPLMRGHLLETLSACKETFDQMTFQINSEDFILSASNAIKSGLYPKFTHAILNPPYKKLKASSEHRYALRGVGIETSNLYTAFISLTLLMLENGGELVAITPRSFCNGPYFKSFRKLLLEQAAIRQIHIFESRNHAFKGDAVLQENIIFRLVKGAEQGDVVLSMSQDSSFLDLTKKRVAFEDILLKEDKEKIIHLPTEERSKEELEMMVRFPNSLDEIGISVSTGPVVDFRLKNHLRQELDFGCAPLIYCLHFTNSLIAHPKPNKKANAIAVNEETSKWLMPTGNYVLVRRLSSKEEKRRLIPALFDPSSVKSEKIGFDNHMNVFHEKKKGLPPLIAKGLTVYLGSTFIDKWFRRFNGHTQVNAGDLRALRYPHRELLELWGKRIGDTWPTQEEIDLMVEGRG